MRNLQAIFLVFSRLSLRKKKEKKRIGYGTLDSMIGIEGTIKDSAKLLNSSVLMIMKVLPNTLVKLKQQMM